MTEPFVTLPSGATVLRASADLFHSLIEAGHTVTINADGEVVVTPDYDLHCDVRAVLDVLQSDLSLLVSNAAAIH